jgi:hypothetical protein
VVEKDRFEDEGYDSADSEDEYQRVRYRRKVREARRAQRARSADDWSRGRARSSSVKGREMVRYQSRRRQEEEPSDSERTIYYGGSDDESRSSRGGPKSKCGDHCGKKEQAFPSAFRHPTSDEEYDSEEDERERKKRRNKRALYAGLATIATVATANGVYQNQKGYRLRKAALDATESPCAAEKAHLRHKTMLQDAFAVGVVAVGLNNLRLAWKKHGTLGDQDKEAHERWHQHRITRDLRRQAAANLPQNVPQWKPIEEGR